MFAGVCAWGVIFGSGIHDSIMKLLSVLNYHVKKMLQGLFVVPLN